MRSTAFLFLSLLALPLPARSQDGTTAFTNVNVLTMERETVLEDHTVVIRDGLIQEIAPSHRVLIPEGARIIQGEGRFLMPGLADMHVTLPGSGTSSQDVEDFLFLFLANNIMVVRGMSGSSFHLEVKRQVSEGAILGPGIWAGAPPLGGVNAQEAQAAVERMLANRRAGFDLQPIAGEIPGEVWDSLAEEAHSRGYTFGGTIPESVGLRKALSSGISTIERMDGYLREIVSEAVKVRLDRGERVPLAEQVEAVEGRRMRAIAAHTRSSDSWVVPALRAQEIRMGPLKADSLLALPEMRFASDFTTEGWILEAGSLDPPSEEVGRRMTDVRRRLLRALSMAGVGILMGTDSPSTFGIPGFSLRHELRSMEAAGLTPYEILVTGTRNVAEYARRELLEPSNFGLVREGNRADLLLLRDNPFQDLEALWNQEGVMLRGRWIPRQALDERLETLAQRLGR